MDKNRGNKKKSNTKVIKDFNTAMKTDRNTITIHKPGKRRIK